MNTPDSITQKIHASADADLLKHVDSLAGPFFALIRDSNPHTFKSKTETDRSGESVIYFREAWPHIVELAFNVNRDAWRERYVNEFMSKMDRLELEIQELKGQI